MAHNTSVFDVIIGNIDEIFTTEHIEAHLIEVLAENNPRPRVFPLYRPKRDGKWQSAVSIAFKGRIGLQHEQVVEIVNGTKLVSNTSDGNVTSILTAELVTKEEVILISEATKATFDCYFLHGFGGDPFKTFRTWPSSSKRPFYWPADALPQSLASAGKLGNFYTFGYDSSFLKQFQQLGFKRARSQSSKLKDIESVAATLLESIRESRPPECRRPIYFVSHSLGGLVASAATILAADGITLMGSKIRRPSLRFYDHESSRPLVEGITFFGTPFKGSSLATWGQFVLPFIRVIGTKGQHIARLREDDSLVRTMLYYLNALQLRTNGENMERPKILTFSESRRMTPIKIRVKRMRTGEDMTADCGIGC